MKKKLTYVLAFVLVIAMIPLQSFAFEKTYEGYEWDDWSLEPEINLAVGGTYPLPDMDVDYDYLVFKDTSGNELSGVVSENNGILKGASEGTVRVYFYENDEEGPIQCTYYGSDGKEHEYMTIHVRKINLSSATTKKVYVPYDGYGLYEKSVYFTLPGVDKYSQVKAESGYLDAYEVAKKRIKVTACSKGNNKFKINIEGKTFTFNARLVPVKLNEYSIVAYKGMKAKKIKVSSDLKSETIPAVTFVSTNKKVATVGKKSGKVRFKKNGSAYIKVKIGTKVVGKCMVEVTPKKQYKAVKNAWKDYKGKLKYSQAKRMNKKYRDCSSFVSRCYYDKSLGRKIYTIGPSSARSWALTAAGQAKWLNQKGKRVSYKAVSVNKLLPGDLIYYRTGYAGKNPGYRHIDHAAMYVGGGFVMDINSSGVKLSYYWKGDSSVKFIGRPLK